MISLTNLLKATLAMASAAAFTLPPAALALDCTKATTDVEKAICANPRLKMADDRMSEAYAALRKRLRGNDLKMLAASQRKWLKLREENASQILELTEARRRFLAGAPESGKGIGQRLIPVFIEQDGDAHSYDVNFELLRFAKPKSDVEKRFNAEVDKVLKQANLSKDMSKSAPEGTRNVQTARMILTYASPKFLSARILSSQSLGGARGLRQTQALNVDLGRGDFLDATSLLDGATFSVLKKDCTQWLLLQKIEQLGEKYRFEDDPSYNDAALEKGLKTVENWTIWQDKAEVVFNEGQLGNYREPAYKCAFETDSLPALSDFGMPF